MYCAKQQSVFGRLFTMDCQEHALEHCAIGLFEWINQSFRSLCVSADKLIARTQFQAMNSRKEHWIQRQINFDVFFTSSHFQPNKLLPGGPFRPVGGGGCDGTLRTPPAYAPAITEKYFHIIANDRPIAEKYFHIFANDRWQYFQQSDDRDQ